MNMLFTDGKLQAFEQMMKQLPRRPMQTNDRKQKPKPAPVPAISVRKEKTDGEQ
ncbi:hypothetical protein [Paenibacillus sp. S150]|uniref:hypothetical protein n=1 Tax=Paenibacillus sp. S150 TaxID=2749826 RepID=UPI001C58B452|nr:hypothetical protein [Paenibacillus sp. S150]MBW4085243.1 hypothetical protein [Paenibacillus sp. S150]